MNLQGCYWLVLWVTLIYWLITKVAIQWNKSFLRHQIFDLDCLPLDRAIPKLFYHVVKVNLLGPGRFECDFRKLISWLNFVTDGLGMSCEIALRWMSLDITDDKLTLVQVMAWCCQTASHLMLPWSMSVSTQIHVNNMLSIGHSKLSLDVLNFYNPSGAESEYSGKGRSMA